MAYFTIEHEVSNGQKPDWHLCFQFGVYHYDDGSSESGFRFIWRRPNGSLQAARGQARISNKQDMFELFALAAKAGWF